MSNNILIKDGNNANVTLHTIEDSTSVHFNQSIPTDIANNTATVVSGGQAVASGMGALVVAQRDALPAGTNLIGGVSVRGISDVSVSPNGLNIPVSIAGTITVGTHAVTQSGTWAITSINSRVAVSVENTNNIAVSLAPPTFNVPVSIANSLPVLVSLQGAITGTNNDGQFVQVGLFVQSQGKVYNAASGTWDRVTGTSVGQNVVIQNTDNIGVSVGGVGTGIATLSKAQYNSSRPTLASGDVSVMQLDARGNLGVTLYSNAAANNFESSPADGASNSFSAYTFITRNEVLNPNSSTWDRLTGTSAGVFIQPNTSTGTAFTGRMLPVGGSDGTNSRVLKTHTDGSLVVHVSNARPAASVAGIVSVWDANTVVPDTDAKVLQGFNHSISITAGYVFNRASNTWDRMTGTSVGLAVVGTVSITGPLPAGTNHLGKVSVEGLSISGVGTQLVSVGGPVSVQGVQIVGRDGSGNARTPYIDASGIARVSIEGSLAVSGSSMTQTVGAAVTSEGYPMLGSDGTNARRLLTTTGGALVVHVSNTAPGGAAAGSTQLVSVAGAVSTQGVQVVGADGAGDARTFLTDTGGRTVISSVAHLVGVSISPNGLNIPVSVANTITVGTHAVTQSGTWNIAALTSINSRVAVSVENTNNIAVSLAPPTFNVPVSIAGTPAVSQSGTWNVGINAGTNLIGAVSVRGNIIGAVSIANIADVSVSPNGLNIPVSVANTITVGTHAVTQSGTWNIAALTSINSRVAVSVENTNNIAVSVAGTPAVTQSGTWNVGLNAGTNLVGAVSISPNGLNIPVSVANTINVATHAVTQSGAWTVSVNDKVSVAGLVAATQSGTWNIGALTSVNSIVKVSIEGNLAVSGSSMTATVGAAVTTEGYPMLGSDGTNSRRLLTTTGGALVVHVSNTAPGGSSGGSTQLVSVGGPVSTQGVQVVGTDGTNARTLLTTTGGALVVHVSNTAPGGASGGGTPMVSVGGAVSTQAVQIAGKDPSGNARTIKTNVSGVTYITTRTFMSQDVFTRPADTTAYAAGATAAPGNAGDLIANSTTAGSVKPLKFRIAKGPGQVAYIRGARMYRTGGTLATGQHNITGAIRLHLFNTATRVSVAGGDNAAFNASPVSNWMGYIDLVAIACAPGLRTSGAVSTQVYWGAPARTGEMIVDLSAAQVSIQGLLETRIAFTPISGEIFTVQIEGFNG